MSGSRLAVAILTISDRAAAGEREARSGPELVEMLASRGWEIAGAAVVPDEADEIVGQLKSWADGGDLHLILTTGGTGFGARDVTPEATLEVIDRQAPGLAEAMRSASLRKTPHAMLSRAVAGLRGEVLIVNLPGSPRAARENLEVILPALPHALQLLAEDPAAEFGHRPPEKRPIA